MKLVLPKGILIPIGGGEDKKEQKIVLTRVIGETGKKNPSVCVVTVATNLPREVGEDYRIAFEDLGIKKVSLMHFDRRSMADTALNLQKIKKCDAVLFSGGDQLKLSSLLGGTQILAELKKRYYQEDKFVVAGTSAGAAAMSDTMIIAGSSRDALIKGQLELTNGLDLINSVFIDTHFTQRGRFGRLIQTVTYNPGVLGLGLGEDTAVVIYKGDVLEVVGTGLVVIADGSKIQYTNLTGLANGDPLTVEGMILHILGPGTKFLLSKRSIQHDVLVKKKKKKKKTK